MKKVLITGANSYIGTSFEKYVAENYSSEFDVHTIDMIDGSWRSKDFGSYDIVFHVAGLAHADAGKIDEATKAKYYAVNTDLAIETCKRAKADGIKQFVFLSSAIIYGDSVPYGKRKMITRETEPQPANFYGDSKLQADLGIQELADNSLMVTILRLPMIYGKGSKGNYATLASMAKKLPIFPDVINERSMLYIENLCEFLAQIMIRGLGGIFWPQNAEYSRTSEIVRYIARANKHKILVSKEFNWAVRLASCIPGKIGGLANKAFGNLSYNQSMSLYGFDYQLYTLKESIKRTEINYVNIRKDPPLVSVITAAYNCEKTIGETIESVQAQTYQNWEMLIVNDCSTDHTIDVVRSYAEKDSRIKLINLSANSGSAAARNTAIENANGRFLAILDSDDLWKQDKLAHQVKFMLEHDYGFTFTSYEIFHDSSDARRTLFKAPKKIVYKQYLRNTIIGNLTVIIDKEKIPEFFIVKGYLEDVLTWMYFLNKGYTAYGLNKNLASYRVAAASKSGNKFKNAKRYYECLKEQPISGIERIIDEICYLFNAIKKHVFGKTIKSS